MPKLQARDLPLAFYLLLIRIMARFALPTRPFCIPAVGASQCLFIGDSADGQNLAD